MEEFTYTMQKYFLKMEHKHGKLKFLLSRATEETSCIINKITETIKTIYDTHGMLPSEKSLIIDPKDKNYRITQSIIYGYNCLLLNTNFQVQNFLTEDVQYGYVVGQWPSLSPYLFIQTIWHCKYEMILAESLIHIPLDLCTEILEIVVKCIHELEHERARHLILRLTSNIYQKCLQNSQIFSTQNLKERAYQLIAYFQMLLDHLINIKITRLFNFPIQTSYEEHGILIKMLLCHTKKCICLQNIMDEDVLINLFTLTYGMHYSTLSTDDIKYIIQKLQQELISLLLNQIKQVDFNEYLYWAEVNDMDNIAISLQRVITIECQEFIQFMKCDIFPKNNHHLEQCLQQIMGSNPEPVLTIQELCHVVEDKSEALQQLIKRYNEWDISVLIFIEENMQFLPNNDYIFLLEYLHHVFMYNNCEQKLQIYKLVLTILMRLDLLVFINVTCQYITRHLDDNPLTLLLYNEKEVMDFIRCNENLNSPGRLRTLVIFFLLNAKAVLSILINIVIGNKSCNQIVFTTDNMLLLRPLISFRMFDQQNILIYCLKNVCMEDIIWDSKKFIDFIDTMLKEKIICPNELMNEVYIPYLCSAPFNNFNIKCILLCVRDILKKHLTINQCNINYALLVINLMKRISFIRRSKLDFLATAEVVVNIKSILYRILFQKKSILKMQEEYKIIDSINRMMDPIDLINLPIISDLASGNFILKMMHDYERRCAVIYTRLRTDARSSAYHHKLASSIKLDRKDFIRHIILHSIDQEEFIFFMTEMTMLNWFYFGWLNERNAFENLMSLTIDSIRLVIVYNNIFIKNKFIELLYKLVKFCKFITKCFKDDVKYVVNVLLMKLKTLNDVFDYMPNSVMFELMISRLQNEFTKIRKPRLKWFRYMEQHIKVYLVNRTPLNNTSIVTQPIEDSNQRQINSDIQEMFITYTFVSACIKLFNTQAHFYFDEIWNSIETINCQKWYLSFEYYTCLYHNINKVAIIFLYTKS